MCPKMAGRKALPPPPPPVSGALEASGALCVGLWAHILQSLMDLVKSLNLILKNDGKPLEGLIRGVGCPVRPGV